MMTEGSNKMIMGSHRNTNVCLKKPLLFLQDLQVKQLEKEVVLLHWTAHSLCPNNTWWQGSHVLTVLISQVKELDELASLQSSRLCSYTLLHKHLPEPTLCSLHHGSWLFVHIEVDCSVSPPLVASFSCQFFFFFPSYLSSCNLVGSQMAQKAQRECRVLIRSHSVVGLKMLKIVALASWQHHMSWEHQSGFWGQYCCHRCCSSFLCISFK